MGISRQSTQSPKAYDLLNLQGGQLAARMSSAQLIARLNHSGFTQFYNPATAVETGGLAPADFFSEAYTFRRYGADVTGATDSTAAINACLEAAAAAGFSMVKVGVPGATLRVDGSIAWPCDQVGIDFQGAQLDCTHQPNNTWTLVPSATEADPTTRVAKIKAHPLENFFAYGPCTAANQASLTGSGFLLIKDLTAAEVLAGVTISNGGSWNFYTHARLDTGAFFTQFHRWTFDTIGSGYSHQFVVNPLPASGISGERNVFLGCRFGISAAEMYVQANNNADTHFYLCSFNNLSGTSGRLFTISNGSVFWSGCHLELSGDADYAIYVTGNAASPSGNSTFFSWDHLEIVVDAAKTNYAIFYCDGTTNPITTGGVSRGSTHFVSGSTYSLPLIGGTGPVTAHGMMGLYVGGTLPHYTADALSIIADSALAAASFLKDGWATSGGHPPTIVNTSLPPSGATNVMKFTVQTGETNVAKLVRSCSPGKVACGDVWIHTTGFTGSNAIFNVTVSYLNANGDVLATFDTTFPSGITTDLAWTLYSLNPGGGGYVRAPKGTTQVQLQMVCNGSGSITGTPIAYAGGFELTLEP